MGGRGCRRPPERLRVRQGHDSPASGQGRRRRIQTLHQGRQGPGGTGLRQPGFGQGQVRPRAARRSPADAGRQSRRGRGTGPSRGAGAPSQVGRAGLLATGQLARPSRVPVHRTPPRLPPGRTGHRQALGHAIQASQSRRRVRPEDGHARPEDARTGSGHGQQDGPQERLGRPLLRHGRDPRHRGAGPQRRGQGQGGEGGHRRGARPLAVAGDRGRPELRHGLGEPPEDAGDDPGDQAGSPDHPELDIQRLAGAQRLGRQDAPVPVQRPRSLGRSRFQAPAHRALRPQAHQPFEPATEDGPRP